MREAAKRETLYAELIIEASKRRAGAWSHHAKTREVLAGIYPAVERMRPTFSDESAAPDGSLLEATGREFCSRSWRRRATRQPSSLNFAQKFIPRRLTARSPEGCSASKALTSIRRVPIPGHLSKAPQRGALRYYGSVSKESKELLGQLAEEGRLVVMKGGSDMPPCSRKAQALSPAEGSSLPAQMCCRVLRQGRISFSRRIGAVIRQRLRRNVLFR
jgi:hypothetical protein